MSILSIVQDGKGPDAPVLGVRFNFKNAIITMYRTGEGKIEAGDGKRLRYLIPVVPQTFRHTCGDFEGDPGSNWHFKWQKDFWKAPRGRLVHDDYHFTQGFWSNINSNLEHPLVDVQHGGIPLTFRKGTRAELYRMLELALATSYLTDTKRHSWAYWNYPDVSIIAGTKEEGPRVVNRGCDQDPGLTRLLQLLATEFYPVGVGNNIGGTVRLRPRITLAPFRTGLSVGALLNWTPRQRMAARRELAQWLRGIQRDPAEYISTWRDVEEIEMDEPAALGFEAPREALAL